MKDYVYIQSTIDIVVTAGLQNEDVTNPDAHIPDRLKVNPIWPKLRILIEAGRHIYPSCIAKWETVKSLVKDGILTIGEEVDSVDDPKVIEKAEDLKEELNIAKKKMKVVDDIKLDDVAK